VEIIDVESVEELTDMVIEKFSDVKNMNISVPTFPEKPLADEQLKTKIMLKPVKDTKQLIFMFPVKDYREHYRTHPLQYFSHLIGHEGPGSILSLLKSKGWAHGLMTGSSGFGAIGFDFFRIVIDLTEAGLSESTEIVRVVFQYIELLKKNGALAWVFHECQSISRMAFRFKEKASPSNYTSSLAGNMHKFAPEDVICGPYLVEEFDKAVIRSCFEFLTPSNLQLILVASSFQPNSEWEVCPWYGSEYKVVPIEDSLQRDLENLSLNDNLRLPDHNEFIPENFTVSHPKLAVPATQPSLLSETNQLRLWHKQDDTFMVPRANVYFEVRTPIAYESVENCILTRLFSDLLKDSLNEFAYPAEVAGLAFNLENTTDGIVVSVYGYNDKLHVLLAEIASKMASFPIDEFHFHRVKDATIRKLKGWFHDAPYSHATYFMAQFTQEYLFTTQEKLDAIVPVTLDHVRSFYRRLFDNCHIECLVHGNVDKEVFRA
jgi:insulysin